MKTNGEIKASRHALRGARGRFVKAPSQRTNGQNPVDPASTFRMPSGTSRFLRNRTTRAVQFNWVLPTIGAVTPQYLEMILRGALAGNHVQQYQLFELMLDNWPELSAAWQELTYGVTRREIVFEPFTEEDEKPTDDAVERAKLVSGVMRRMNPRVEEDENGLKDTVRDLLDGWLRGFVVLEVMWQTIELSETAGGGFGTGPRATAWVQPQTYGFNQEGVMGYNTAQQYTDTSLYSAPSQMQLEPFQPDKFLVGIHKVKSGTPLGGPMLRTLAWWWVAANFSSDWLLNLAQVFGLPFRWCTYPSAAPDEQVAVITDMLANMGSAGWAAFPTGVSLELKDPVRAAGESPQGHLLDRADKYARSLILGQTMTGTTMARAGGRGGQAFGTVEAQLKQDRLEAASEYVAEIFNTQLIPSILKLNYGDTDEPPTCRFLQENEGTLQDAQRDQILINSGLPVPLSHMRKKYSIPQPEPGEEVMVPIVAPKGGGFGSPGGGAGEQPNPELTLQEKAQQGEPVAEQQANRAAEQEKITTKLEQLSLISDDELFGREFKRLSSGLVTVKE